MFIDTITITDCLLRNPATPAEEVQRIFREWWGRRDGLVFLEDEAYVLPVKTVERGGFVGARMTLRDALHFPKVKLTEGMLALLEENTLPQEADRKADEAILWGAGRAAAIAVLPALLADVGALMANEAYMIHRVAKIYGHDIDESVVAMLVGIAGGSLARRIGVSLLPVLKIPVVAGSAYAIGKAAKAYVASGATLDRNSLHDIFIRAKKFAKGIDWRKHEVKPETEPSA